MLLHERIEEGEPESLVRAEWPELNSDIQICP